MLKLEELLSDKQVNYESISNLMEVKKNVQYEELKLGDFLVIKNGNTPSTKIPENWIDGDLYLYGLRDIKNSGVVNEAERKVKRSSVQGRLFPKDSIVFSTTATIGEFALIKTEGSTDRQVAYLYCRDENFKRERLNVKYLYYYCNILKHWAIENSKKSVGTFASVNMDDFRNYTIKLPSLSYQNKVVDTLDVLSALVAELRAELRLRGIEYEHYLNDIMEYLLDVSKGNDKEPSKFVTKILIESMRSNVEYKKLSEVFHIKGGYTPSTKYSEYWEDGIVNWFRVEDIRKSGRVLTDSIKKVSESAVKKSSLLPADSIIYSTTATIGEYALITKESLINQQIVGLSKTDEFKDKLNMKYMLYYCAIITKNIGSIVNIGGAFMSVNMESFKSIEIPIPPIDIQNKIVKVLDYYFEYSQDIQGLLPQEIALREKQFAFYLEGLFTL